MSYPKYIFVLWLIMVFLGGYVLMSLGWIGITGFMVLIVLSLPIYWLETYWRNQAMTEQIKADKLRILPFRGWSFERLLYYQFLLLLVLSIPSLFFEESTSSIIQLLLSFTFVLGLLVSKYYRERRELQSFQLTKQQLKVLDYGFTKKVDWREITGFLLTGNQLLIERSGRDSLRLQPQGMKEEDRAYLMKTLKGFAQKKGLSFQLKLDGKEEIGPWYLSDWKRGLLFLGATALNVLIVFSW